MIFEKSIKWHSVLVCASAYGSKVLSMENIEPLNVIVLDFDKIRNKECLFKTNATTKITKNSINSALTSNRHLAVVTVVSIGRLRLLAIFCDLIRSGTDER